MTYRPPPRRRSRGSGLEDVVIGAGVALAVIAAVFALALLWALGVYVGWNLGVYGLAHAVHTQVQHISLWTSLGVSVGLSTAGNLLRSESRVNVEKKT